MKKSIKTLLALVALAIVLSSCEKNVIKPVYFEINVPEQGHLVQVHASSEVESKTISAGETEIVKGTNLTLGNYESIPVKVFVGGKAYTIEANNSINLR